MCVDIFTLFMANKVIHIFYIQGFYKLADEILGYFFPSQKKCKR